MIEKSGGNRTRYNFFFFFGKSNIHQERADAEMFLDFRLHEEYYMQNTINFCVKEPSP